MRFGLYEIPCGLSRQQPDQIDEAWIGLRGRRHCRFAGRVDDHTKFSAVVRLGRTTIASSSSRGALRFATKMPRDGALAREKCILNQ